MTRAEREAWASARKYLADHGVGGATRHLGLRFRPGRSDESYTCEAYDQHTDTRGSGTADTPEQAKYLAVLSYLACQGGAYDE